MMVYNVLALLKNLLKISPIKYYWYTRAFLGLIFLFVIYLSSLYSYILFHTLAELISIIIAAGIFMLAWNSRHYMKNSYLLFIGIAFFFIAGIDLAHTLSYKGMNILTGFDVNLPTQLWIAGRYLQGLSFITAILFLKRKINPHIVFFIFTAIFFFILTSIFYLKIFPVMYVEGVGLTGLKKVSEYIISIIFVSAGIILFHKKQYFDQSVYKLLLLFIVFTVASELSFTGYVSVYGFSNMAGHLLKIVAYYLLYKAIIETGLLKPYNLLFRDVQLKSQQLEKERNNIQKYLDIAGVIFVVLDIKQKVLLINKKACEILGFDAGEIIGKNWFDNFIPVIERKRVKSGFKKLINGKIKHLENLKNNILTRDGQQRLVAWHNTVIYENGKIVSVLSSGEDITEKQLAEERLHESESKFRAVAMSANDAIVSVNKMGEIISWNKGAETIFGYSEMEIFGRNLTLLIPERFQIKHLNGMHKLGTKPPKPVVAGRTMEVLGLRRDGSEFPIELSLSSWNIGKEIFYTAIVRDITERKESEKRKDEFISIASHELKTPITSLKGFTQILLSQIEKRDFEKFKFYLLRINDQINHLTQLSNDLLDVTRIQAGKLDLNREKFDLGELIKETIGDLQTGSGGHKIVYEGGTKNIVTADQNRIGQVLINLLANAIKYSPGQKQVIVRVKKDGNFMMVSVQDFGIGIVKEDQKQIFESFFRAGNTTGGKFSGLGLGLHICYKIIQRHGGKIWVESEEGKGSTFFFTLPLKPSKEYEK